MDDKVDDQREPAATTNTNELSLFIISEYENETRTESRRSLTDNTYEMNSSFFIGNSSISIVRPFFFSLFSSSFLLPHRNHLSLSHSLTTDTPNTRIYKYPIQSYPITSRPHTYTSIYARCLLLLRASPPCFPLI